MDHAKLRLYMIQNKENYFDVDKEPIATQTEEDEFITKILQFSQKSCNYFN